MTALLPAVPPRGQNRPQSQTQQGRDALHVAESSGPAAPGRHFAPSDAGSPLIGAGNWTGLGTLQPPMRPDRGEAQSWRSRPMPAAHRGGGGKALTVPSSLGITPAAGWASPVREGIVKDCASWNPDVVVGNSWPPIRTAIKTARSRMRGVPATTASTGRWVPVRAVAVSHLHHGRHRTRHCPFHLGSERSRMRRYRSHQSQRPSQGQSESAQFRCPLTRGFAAAAITA